MAGTWLYSISKRPGYHFIIDGKKIPVTIDSYRDLIESGQLDRDRDWHLTQHWDHIEVGDQVFIYTGDEDVGILGFATVARVNLAQQTMDLSFDIEKCKMLLRSPVPASKVRRWKLNLRKNVVDLNSVATRLHKLLPWARPVPSDIPRTVQAGPPSDAAGHTGSNPAPVNTGSGIPKLLVLKPIMWNDQGYQRPAGCPSTSGYSHEHGFGHEEWNNNPNWFWQGWKVFHTEASQKLRDAAENGNLGMLMVASRGGKAMALGVATNVYINNETDMAAIAQAVGQDKDWPAVWDLRTVRTQYPNREHFLQQCQVAKAWIRWRCLPSNYYWFPKPVVLDPMRLTGKKRLAMHHGRFTEITAAVMLDIIDGHLPGDRSAIREWLTCGEFSQIERKGTLSQSRGEKIMRRMQRRRNAPTDRRFEYWVKGNRTVEPLHDRLQKLFVDHLKAQHIVPVENEEYIDVRYAVDGLTTLCEVKPTDNVETKYAIRAAIGQLLEYRFKSRIADAAMEIVLGCRPEEWEIEFAKSLRIAVTYFDKSTGTGSFVRA